MVSVYFQIQFQLVLMEHHIGFMIKPQQKAEYYKTLTWLKEILLMYHLLT